MGKPRAILDSSVVVAGIGWRGGDARAVFRLLAVGGFASWRTPLLTAEWSSTVERVAQTEKRWGNPNWVHWLEWLKHASKLTADIPMKSTVKRDPTDDPVIMSALASRAECIVTYDGDLLSLEKPHGVWCLTPRAFLGHVLRQQ